MRNAVFVILGASLWATDTLFRHPLVRQISPITIVYFEHMFAAALALILVLITDRKRIFLNLNDTLGAAFVGVFGSAIATVLFTMSFQFINPSVAILIQKLQPIVVILLSAVFLNEKLKAGFFALAAVAMGSAFMISFPTGIHVEDLHSVNSMGCLFALIAAVLWAVSTVVGKSVLKHTPGNVLTFWRFAFGLLALFLVSRRVDQVRIEIPFVPTEPAVLRALFLMALIPGFIAVTLYYKGLHKVPASVATILELAFPLVAIWINAYFLGFQLSHVQLLGAVALLASMTGITLVYSKR